MKGAIVVKVAAVVAVVAGLAGCQDLKPLQADIADLKSQVAKLQSDTTAAKSAAKTTTGASVDAGTERRGESFSSGSWLASLKAASRSSGKKADARSSAKSLRM